MMSMKVINVLEKIKSIEETNVLSKLFMLMYVLIKTETLFEEMNSIVLAYTIYDIQNILNVEIDRIINNLKKIKSEEIADNQYIKINNINDFFKRYHEYQKNSY